MPQLDQLLRIERYERRALSRRKRGGAANSLREPVEVGCLRCAAGVDEETRQARNRPSQ